MRFSFLMGLAAIACVFGACGGKAIPPDDNGDDAGPYGRNPDGSNGDGNTYVDPHCGDAGTPPTETQCDVFDPHGCIGNQCCPAGEACYPVAIPPDKPCATEVYGSFCLGVGGGSQGAPCDNDVGCAAGFVCLITGASTQCAKLCDYSGHGCANGFVCEPIDVPGFSACL